MFREYSKEMDHSLTVLLAVFVTVASSQLCQISVQVTRNNSSSMYNDQPTLYLQAGDSVTIECNTPFIEYDLHQNGERIDSPLEFTVTGDNLAITNTIYKCRCGNEGSNEATAQTIIQTVTIPLSEFMIVLCCYPFHPCDTMHSYVHYAQYILMAFRET